MHHGSNLDFSFEQQKAVGVSTEEENSIVEREREAGDLPRPRRQASRYRKPLTRYFTGTSLNIEF